MPRISYYVEPTGEQARISQPTLASVKAQLCQRLGMRPHELSFEARELLDIYVRAKSKVIAIDRFLAATAVVVDDGRVTPALRAYVNLLKASVSCLTALTHAMDEMPRDGNGRIDHALEALAAEGKRVREAVGEGVVVRELRRARREQAETRR